MVSFAEDPELKNANDPFEILDPQLNDFSFADSFLDLDSIQDWFEDKPYPDTAAQENDSNGINADTSILMKDPTVLAQQVFTGSDPNAVGSAGVVNADVPVCENLVTLGNTIEEGMGKISLVGGFQSSVGIGGNGVNSDTMMDKDEGESSESESSSTSSSSSSSTSSGSSSSSDSGSSSDDDNEGEEQPDKKGEGKTEVIGVEIEEGEIRDSNGQETAAVDDDGINDDEDDATGGPIRSKKEVEVLPPVPLVDVTLEPHHQMQPVGVIMSIVGTRVIVEGLEKHYPLDEASILWMIESRTPLGVVDEIFGPVRNPYYVVRYNSENEVPAGSYGGALVSFVPEFANHVLSNKDLYKKGYDASGLNDEEMTDESEFSDDEKEAEYKRMQRVTKRGVNDQNPGNRKNNRRKAPVKAGAIPTVTKRGVNDQNPGIRKNNRKEVPVKAGGIPTYPVAPAIPLLDHGNCSPLSGIGQGLNGATTIFPPFPPTSADPNSALNGIRTNGASFPHPHSALLPNGFPTNCASWFSENTHNSYQFPGPEIPFQHQLHSSQGSPSTTMFPGVLQPNIFAQPTYRQGLVGQNQMTFGLSSHLMQIQPPIRAREQEFLFNEMQLERNHNLHSSTISGNCHVPRQFRPGASAGRGRKTFHRGGRKGWRPAK